MRRTLPTIANGMIIAFAYKGSGFEEFGTLIAKFNLRPINKVRRGFIHEVKMLIFYYH